jgi:ParB-like chromosome segregation protein Spo0J
MALMKINELKEHEEINPFHLKEFMEKIKSDGILKKPIVVDKNTKIVLDGAHRLNALKALGCKKIPAVLVNYRSLKIKVLR